jgi:hypothetical protein
MKTKPFNKLKGDKLTPEDIKEIDWQVEREKCMLEYLDSASATTSVIDQYLSVCSACYNYEVLTEDNRRGYPKELGELNNDFRTAFDKIDLIISKYKKMKEEYEGPNS